MLVVTDPLNQSIFNKVKNLQTSIDNIETSTNRYKSVYNEGQVGPTTTILSTTNGAGFIDYIVVEDSAGTSGFTLNVVIDGEAESFLISRFGSMPTVSNPVYWDNTNKMWIINLEFEFTTSIAITSNTGLTYNFAYHYKLQQ
jgi:hypothetical protein